MRTGILFLSSAVAALGLVVATPSASDACCFCCCWGGGGYGYGRGYGYGYGYTPGYYAPPANYYAARPMPMVHPPVAATSVSAKDDTFDPMTVNVQVGTTVQWVNSGKHAHTVTSD